MISYGAKSLPEGGYFSLPKLTVDGAILIGDSAGFMNGQRLKGIHLAMKSGMIGAESIYEEFFQEDESVACFETIEELTQKIALYLPDEERRQSIADAGQQIVHERDLYQNRVDQIIRLYWELRDESARRETGRAVRPSPAQG